jgi:hypothetical protein
LYARGANLHLFTSNLIGYKVNRAVDFLAANGANIRPRRDRKTNEQNYKRNCQNSVHKSAMGKAYTVPKLRRKKGLFIADWMNLAALCDV